MPVVNDGVARGRKACHTIHVAANALDPLGEDLELGDLYPLIHEAEEAYKALGQAVANLKRGAHAEMEAAGLWSFHPPESALPPLLRSKPGVRPRWEGVRLAHVVAARAVDKYGHDEDGVAVPVAVVAAKVADEIVDAAGLDAPSKGWRKESLKKKGIQPGAFVEEEEGTPTVRFQT